MENKHEMMAERALYKGKREYVINCKSKTCNIAFSWSTVEGVEDACNAPDFPEAIPRTYVTLRDRSFYVTDAWEDMLGAWETYLINTL